MSVFLEFCDETPDRIFDKFDIDVIRINNKYAMESAFGTIDDSVAYEAGESQPVSEKKSWLKSMAERIGRLIRDFCEMLKNMFSPQDHVNLENYLKSADGKEQFDYDLIGVQNGVDAEIRKGRKLIQAISKGTHVDDKTVETFVDNAAKVVQKYAVPALISVGSIKMFNAFEANSKKINNEMQEAANEGDRVTDSSGKEKIHKIYNSMVGLVKDGLKARKICMRQAQLAANGGK